MALSLFSQKKTSNRSPETILEHARIKSEKIIERALIKSVEIIKDLEAFREDMKKEMRTIFQQSADSYIHTITQESNHFSEECEALVPQIQKKYMDGVEKTIQVFQLSLNQELIPVRQIVEQQVKTSAELLQKRVEEEWQKARTEIEAYKTLQKQQINRSIEEKV